MVQEDSMFGKKWWRLGGLLLVVLLAVVVAVVACAPKETQKSSASEAPLSVISGNITTKYSGSDLGTGVVFGLLVIVISAAAYILLGQWRGDRGQPVFKKHTISLITVALFIVCSVVWLFLGSYVTVDSQQIGVVIRQGEANRVAYPGANWLLPYLEKVVLFPTRDFTYATMADPTKGNEDYRDVSVDMVTHDGVQAKLNYTIQGRLNPAKAVGFYSRFGTLENGIGQLIKFPSRVLVRQTLQEFNAGTLYESMDDMEGVVVGKMKPIMEEGGLTLGLFGFRKPVIGKLMAEGIGDYELELNNAQVAVKQEVTQSELVKVEKQKALQEEEKARGRKLSAIQDAEGVAESTKKTADANAYKTETEAKAQARAIEEINRALATNPRYLEYLRVIAWQQGGAKVPAVVGAEAPGIWMQLNPGETQP